MKVERCFNTEGICVPELHYMVRLDDRLKEMKHFYVDRGKYFVINRGRQYGKTTTLRALAKYLRKDYLIFSLDFLAQLRRYYIDREEQAIFHSVILAGVYDIKNLKLKLRPEAEHQYNSPWNIAAEFDVDMSFTGEQIAHMLREYESDHQVGMEVEKVAQEVYQYTSGYPYLVSAVCKFLDEKIPGRAGFENGAKVWTREGVSEAVKLLLKRNTSLFDSMAKQIDAYRDLREMIEKILYQGKQISFSPMERSVNLGMMFGFLKEEDGFVAVANRIFETALLNMFITEEAVHSDAFRYGQRDVIVDYLGEQFIVELKIWHGNEYNERGEKQLSDYLDYFHLKKGYMLSFNFNKKKEIGVRVIRLEDREIVEAVV